MKNLILIIFLLPLVGFGQNQKYSIKHEAKSPEYFIDSVQVDPDNMLINTSNIVRIDVAKKGNGQIYITYKKEANLKKLNTLSLNDTLPAPNDIIIIDGKIIKNPNKFWIDPSFIGNVKKTKSSQLIDNTGDFIIIQITSTQKVDELKKDQSAEDIRIKGQTQDGNLKSGS